MLYKKTLCLLLFFLIFSPDGRRFANLLYQVPKADLLFALFFVKVVALFYGDGIFHSGLTAVSHGVVNNNIAFPSCPRSDQTCRAFLNANVRRT